LKVGFIDAGTVTGTFDCRLIPGHTIVASNSGGPETPANFVADHRCGSIAGTKQQADECDAVILATRRVRVADALKGIDWRGLIDVTNAHVDPVPDISLAGSTRSRAASLGRTSSELVAEMTVAARLVKPISDMPMAPERGTIL
jgi:predicted dinucleotide-binding enzyme